jgi:hypothetical protein
MTKLGAVSEQGIALFTVRYRRSLLGNVSVVRSLPQIFDLCRQSSLR